MLKKRGMIIRFILVLLFLLTMAILVSGQDEGVIPEEIKTEASEPQELVEPAETVTRLDVTIIDGVNDKLIKLNNCIVHVIGELHVVNDSFTYQKTFVEGDRYEITIHFRPKK
jgi:hypothetical protein